MRIQHHDLKKINQIEIKAGRHAYLLKSEETIEILALLKGTMPMQKRKRIPMICYIIACLFLCGFVIGILLANKGWLSQAVLIGSSSQEQILAVTSSRTAYETTTCWLSLLSFRFIPWIFFLCVCQSIVGVFLLSALFYWQGCCLGFIGSAFFMHYGWRSLFVLLFGFLPHGLVYLLCLIASCIWLRRCQNTIGLHAQFSKADIHRQTEKYRQIGIRCLLGVLFFLGVLLEYYVNPRIMTFAVEKLHIF